MSQFQDQRIETTSFEELRRRSGTGLSLESFERFQEEIDPNIRNQRMLSQFAEQNRIDSQPFLEGTLDYVSETFTETVDDINAATALYSIVGSGAISATDLPDYHADYQAEADPDFNPYKGALNILDQEPWLKSDYDDGAWGQYDNQEAFDAYRFRMKRDFELRQVHADNGAIRTIASSLPGQAVDLFTGGLIIRAGGLVFKGGKWLFTAEKAASSGQVLRVAIAARNTAVAQKMVKMQEYAKMMFKTVPGATAASKIATRSSLIVGKASSTFKSTGAAGKITIEIAEKGSKVKSAIDMANRYRTWVAQADTASKVFLNVASTSVKFGTLNALQEGAIGVISPDRTVDTMDEMANGFIMGALLGGAIHGATKGLSMASAKAKVTAMANEFAEAKSNIPDNLSRIVEEEDIVLRDLAEGKVDTTHQKTFAFVETARNTSLLKKAREKYLGTDVIISESPNQKAYDDSIILDEIGQLMDLAPVAKGSNVVFDVYAKSLSLTSPQNIARGGGQWIGKSKASNIVQYLNRVFFDDATHTVHSEQGIAQILPAESHKMLFDGYMTTFRNKLHKTHAQMQKTKEPQMYVDSLGNEIDLTQSASMPSFHNFHYAVMDHRRRVATDPTYKEHTAPPHVREANQLHTDYFNEIALEAKRLGLIDEIDDNFLTRQWDIESILSNKDEFIDLMTKDFLDRYDAKPLNERVLSDRAVKQIGGDEIVEQAKEDLDAEFKGEQSKVSADNAEAKKKIVASHNKKVADEKIRLKEEVDKEFKKLGKGKRKLQAKAREDLAKFKEDIDNQKAAALSEQKTKFVKAKESIVRKEPHEQWLIDTHPDLYQQYRASLNDAFKQSAERATESITDPIAVQARGERTVKQLFQPRALDITDHLYNKFFNAKGMDVLSSYHHKISGKLAVYKAVKDMPVEVTDYINHLTGRNIVDEADNQILFDAALSEANKKASKLRKLGKVKEARKLIQTAERGNEILTKMLYRITGSPILPNAQRAGLGMATINTIKAGTTFARLGMAASMQLLDAATAVLAGKLKPGDIGAITKFVRRSDGVPIKSLEHFLVGMEDSIDGNRSSHYIDLSDNNRGKWRNANYHKFDSYSRKGLNFFYRANAMRATNEALKITYTHQVLGDSVTKAIQFGKVSDLQRQGLSLNDALEKVGVKQDDFARMAHHGMDIKVGAKYRDLIFKHGTDIDGNRPWGDDLKAFEDYDRAIYPRYEKWYKEPVNRSVYDVAVGMVNRQVKDMVMEPKIGSRPLINDNGLGSLFNMFQNFSFAFGNQTANTLRGRRTTTQMKYLVTTFGISALIGAIRDRTSRRRSFEETAELWSNNPNRMIYETISRSSILGWFSRPMGFLDSTPIGPGKFLDADVDENTYHRPQSIVSALGGPAADWMGDVVDPSVRWISNGNLSPSQQRRLYKTIPGNNLWQLNLINNFADPEGTGESLIGPDIPRR